MIPLQDRLKLAEEWLLNSGIQAPCGGIHAWVDATTSEPSFLYSEATGYFISTMSFLYRQEQKDEFVRAIKDTFDFLQNEALGDQNLYRCRREISSSKFAETYCLFDNGIILLGLTNALNSAVPLDIMSAARDLGDAMINRFAVDTEEPILRLKDGKPIIAGNKWSLQRKPHYIKVAAGLKQLSYLTRDKSYDAAANIFIDNIVLHFLDHGGLQTADGDEKTYLHPFCYAIEGLHLLSRPCDSLVTWLRKCIKTEQYLPAQFPSGEFVENTDSLAQSLRILLFSGHKETKESQLLLERLLSYQVLDGTRQSRGGFRYSSNKPNHLNSWSTMFAIQAISGYESNNREMMPFV